MFLSSAFVLSLETEWGVHGGAEIKAPSHPCRRIGWFNNQEVSFPKGAQLGGERAQRNNMFVAPIAGGFHNLFVFRVRMDDKLVKSQEQVVFSKDILKDGCKFTKLGNIITKRENI